MSQLNKITEDIVKKIELPFSNKLSSKTPIIKSLDNVLKSEVFSMAEKSYLEKFAHSFKIEAQDANIKFSHFDLMGKNIAFDYNKNTINGIYDFGECGIDNIMVDFAQIGLTFNKSTISTIAKYYKELTQIDINPKPVDEYSLYFFMHLFYKNPNKESIDGIKFKIKNK